MIAPLVRPAASLYAAVKSSCAWAAAASARCIVPLTVPGGNPVTAVPGLNPRSPLTVVAPVLVTVEAARTANVPAGPTGRGRWRRRCGGGGEAPDQVSGQRISRQVPGPDGDCGRIDGVGCEIAYGIQ